MFTAKERRQLKEKGFRFKDIKEADDFWGKDSPKFKRSPKSKTKPDARVSSKDVDYWTKGKNSRFKRGTVKDVPVEPTRPFSHRIRFTKNSLNRKFDDRAIRKLATTGIIEVIAKRRIWPIDKADAGQKTEDRRFWATSKWKFLFDNKKDTKFVAPKGIRPRNKRWYKKRNLMIVWCLIRQDWRMINLDEYDVLNYQPLKTKEQEEEFMTYYRSMKKKGTGNKLAKAKREGKPTTYMNKKGQKKRLKAGLLAFHNIK